MSKTIAQKARGGLFAWFCDDEAGATAIEYGLLIALLGIAIAASMRAYTGETAEMYLEIESTLETRTTAAPPD